MESENMKNEEMSKEMRIVKFLGESKNLVNREEIKNLWVKKYELSEKSENINLRVLERFFGEYNKFSDEKKKERKEILKSECERVKIDYSILVNDYKNLREKLKRSNRLKNFLELN
jgi:hypothetical protein